MAKSDVEEVNLLDLLATFTAALRRNLALTLLLPLTGAVIALAVAYKSSNRIESSLLMETSLLSVGETKFIMEELVRLDTFPGLTVEQQAELAGLRYDISMNDQESELNEKSLYLEITVTVRDPAILPALQAGIIKYINESPSVVRHRGERQKFYSELVKKIDQEIAAMEVIKKESSLNAQAQSLNPADLYSSSVDLYKQKMQFEIRRDQISTVHLISGFDSVVAAGTSKVVALVIGLVVGFVCVCAVLFIQYFTRYVANFETTR
jgi:hypothetical protein